MPNSQLFNRWLQHAPDYVSFGLVIVLGFLLARLTWMFFPAEPRPPVVEALSSAASDTTQADLAQRNFGDEIASAHLFGSYSPDEKVEKKPANVRQTQLALKLNGVYATSGLQSYAVIEEGGKQQGYVLGEEIGTSGAVLEKVLADHVLLRRSGVLEKLELPRPDKVAGLSMSANEPLDYPEPEMEYQEPDYEPPPETYQPNGGAVPPGMQGGADFMDGEAPPEAGQGQESANLGQFRDAVLNNNMQLLEVVTPQPYEQDGKFLGFQLSPGSNVAVFNQLGLQAGDVVTAINGTPLDSPAVAMNLLNEVSTAPQVTLDISRNGQPMSLPISFQ